MKHSMIAKPFWNRELPAVGPERTVGWEAADNLGYYPQEQAYSGLCEHIRRFCREQHKIFLADANLTLAADARCALSTVWQALLDAGDEVVVLGDDAPSRSRIELAGGRAVTAPATGTDLETELTARVTARTKALLLDNREQPGETVLDAVKTVAFRHELLVVARERFDTVSALPYLLYGGFRHSVSICEFSPPAAGWGTAALIGPEYLIDTVRYIASLAGGEAAGAHCQVAAGRLYSRPGAAMR